MVTIIKKENPGSGSGGGWGGWVLVRRRGETTHNLVGWRWVERPRRAHDFR